MDWGAWILASLVFLAVAALCLLVGTTHGEWSRRKRLGQRLDRLAGRAPKGTSPGAVSLLREELAERLQQLNRAQLLVSVVRWVDRFLEQADVRLRPTTLLAISAACAFLGLLLHLLLRLPMYVLPAAMASGLVPMGWVYLQRRGRLKSFEAQLPEALDMLARALRAGHSLPTGLQMIGQEMPHPVGIEFLRIYEAQNLGLPLEQALDELAERVPLVDVRFFVTAVAIQRQTGGDLAEILDKLSYVIRERFKLYGQVRALTAEGRLSGWVLNLLPVVVFVALLYINPGYVLMLFKDPIGHKMLAGAGIMQILGAVAIRRIVHIKV
jgi:tight adherence protein B